MGIIAKTFTRGFRISFFRNQPVHQFYGHLQAVLREISPSGELDHLFARPESVVDGQALPAEMEWSTALEGEHVMFKDLSPDKQRAAADFIGQALEKIKKYAEERHGKSGKEKDYAEYLKAVAVSPDVNQIFMIRNQPILVQWGLTCENGNHPGQGIYAGWDEFIAEIHRKAEARVAKREQIVLPPEPPREEVLTSKTEQKIENNAATAPVAAAAAAASAKKTPEPQVKAASEPEPEEKKPKRMLACGLGDYEWVKWLAIILAIIILLLLLLRFIPPAQSSMPQLPPGMTLPLMGGAGGGGMSGGDSGGAGDNGGSKPTPGSICPKCGHKVPTGESHAPEKTSQPSTTETPRQPANSQPQNEALPAQSADGKN
ncbi:MAG: hypothetical protein EOM80_04395 [Erysipelotrichia bacterium]|nr:hypothetical protein [Erysipelotrichia bacterium]